LEQDVKQEIKELDEIIEEYSDLENESDGESGSD